MDWLTSFLEELRSDWLIYASMPFIAAFIGYTTKQLAVEMIFKPLEFRGIPPLLGWQGILPRNAPRMTSIIVDTAISRLINVQDIFGRIDPEELTKRIEEPMLRQVDELTRELMLRYQPGLWESLPVGVQQLIIRRIQAEAPKVVHRMVEDFRTNIDSVVDLRHMAVNAILRDKALMVRIIRQTGRNEMNFMIRAGGVFGLVIGLAQVAAWAATHNPLIMPLFGFMVGLSTDWIALKMIFYPREPKKILGIYKFQGLFQRRREEVIEDYGTVIATEILTPENVIEAMLTGPQSDRLIAMILNEVQRTLDAQVGLAKPLVLLTMGGTRYEELKQDIVKLALERLPETAKGVQAYAMEAMDVHNTVTAKMKTMSALQFENLLRPAFKQDEWKVILAGGILGGIVGELQVLLLLENPFLH